LEKVLAFGRGRHKSIRQGADQLVVSVYRSIARHSGTYAIATYVSRLSALLLLPIYTSYLTPADYGVLELLEMAAFVFNSLLGAQLGRALLYFYPKADSPEAQRKTVGVAFLAALGLGTVGAAVGILAGDALSLLVFESRDYAHLFLLSFGVSVFSFPREVCFSWLRAVDRSGTFVAAELLRLAVSIVLNIVFLAVYHLGLLAILYSNLIVSALTFLGLSYIVFGRSRPQFDWRIFKAQIRYGFPLGVGGVGMLVMHFGDRFFLQRSTSLSDVGIYSLAYKLGMLVGYVQLPFWDYWSAQMHRVAAKSGGKRVYSQVGTYYFLTITTCGVGISLFASPMIVFLTTEQFHRAAVFVPLLAAGYVVRGLADYFRNVQLIEAKTTLSAGITWTSAAAALVLYGVLIPRFQIWGAVWSTVIVFVVMLFLAYWGAGRRTRYPFELGRIARILVCAVAAVALTWSTQPPTFWMAVLWGTGGMLLFCSLLFLTRVLRPEEWRALLRFLAEIRTATRRVKPEQTTPPS